MTLDPQMSALLQLLGGSGAPPLHQLTPADARIGFGALRALYGAGPAMARVENHRITADGGGIDVRLLVPCEPARGIIVYFHGGGWVLGRIDEFDTLGRKLAARTACAVVLVDYRLAPEHRFPTAPDDAYAATVWVAERAAAIAGADVPLLVAGDSAGGNLATVTARRARDRGGPDLAMQILVYPVTDCDLDTASYLDPATQLLVGRDAGAWFWDQYVPDVARRRDPDASPLRAADLSRLPPAVVLTAGYDPLRDEGEAYAARLLQAGVSVTFRRFHDQAHAFFQFTGVLDASDRAIELIGRAIDDRLAELAGGHARGAIAISANTP
jgi:acetyl esterase